MDKLIQLHIKNNYYVKIKPISNIGCVVTFPNNILYKIGALDRTYMICNNEESIEIFDLETHKQISSFTVNIERFGIRILILQDILLKTLARKMSQNLLIIEDTKKNKNLFDVLKIPMTDEEQDLEKKLCIKFRELVLGRIDHHIDEKLSLSYDMLLKCFEKGGL